MHCVVDMYIQLAEYPHVSLCAHAGIMPLLTVLEPQSHFGDEPVKFQVACLQNGAAVPIWRQTSQIPSRLSPKRDCGSKRVNGMYGPFCLTYLHLIDRCTILPERCTSTTHFTGTTKKSFTGPGVELFCGPRVYATKQTRLWGAFLYNSWKKRAAAQVWPHRALAVLLLIFQYVHTPHVRISVERQWSMR